MTALIAGLSATDSKLYRHALHRSCEVRHQIHNLTLSHHHVNDVAPVYLDGQVNIVDGNSDGVTRTLQMGFLDPDHLLHLDADSPTRGVGGLDRLLSLRTFVREPGWDFWVAAPVGVFRPSKIGRNGEVVTVEAQDKACLHLRNTAGYVIPKRTNVVHAIKTILSRSGETRFRFPTNNTHRLPVGRHVGGPDDDRQPWVVARKLARSIGYQLFYDTTGYACLRRLPNHFSWNLVEHGDGANTLSRIQVSTDLTTIRNRVVVTGHTRPHKNRKSRVVTGVATPPASHPLSGQALGQNGHPWYNTAYFDEPDIHSTSDATKFAKARLKTLLTEQTDVSTTTTPVWHLQAQDLMRLQTASGGAIAFRLLNASIPLGDDENGMTIGYTQRVRRPSAGRLRRR